MTPFKVTTKNLPSVSTLISSFTGSEPSIVSNGDKNYYNAVGQVKRNLFLVTIPFVEAAYDKCRPTDGSTAYRVRSP